MENIIFHQLFDEGTNTYTYILGDAVSQEAIIIDPVLEQVERDITVLNQGGFKLKYIIDTHVHADHITGSYRLKKATGAKNVIGFHNSLVKNIDIFIADNDILYIGDLEIKAISTPGHTGACMSFLIGNMIFTGDLLFIRGTGRTDFQSGSAEDMYQSIMNKIYTLSDSCIIYPGHDYQGLDKSTVGEEKKYNTRISEDISQDTFLKTMDNLHLPYPARIDSSVPANKRSGYIQ